MKTKLLTILSIISFNLIISQGTNFVNTNYNYQQAISSAYLYASTSVSDHDNDGVYDATDLDDDNDGIPDTIESNGIDPLTDNDNDGIPIYIDDNDNDNTIGDQNGRVEYAFDLDHDGIPNHFDLDSDGDGLFDVAESDHIQGVDTNRDGILEGNVGSNGLVDVLETTPDSGSINYTMKNTDFDNYNDFLDIDDDNDHIPTMHEYPDANGNLYPDDAADSDMDGTPNYLDVDDDGDGINTIFEDVALPHNYPQDGNPLNDDTDGDGIANYLDVDDDNDGLLTIDEHADDNGNHEPDDALDSDGDGIPDYLDDIRSNPTYPLAETVHWFMGRNAGLDFSTTPPTSVASQIFTIEGSSAISDSNGQLLMYTDGETVYNRNNSIMPNGTDLLGNSSSTQSALIVPQPLNQNIYYIFTADQSYGYTSFDGIRYTVVDMSLDGGLGAVVLAQKNVTLINHATEKLTAVAGNNQASYWVLTLAPHTNDTAVPYHTLGSNFDTFYAFQVTASGVSNTAVISQLPVSLDGGAGYMKFSHDGTRVAMANMLDNSAYILDFDAATGVVSNPVSLLSTQNEYPYGIEFSPDDSKLYISFKDNKLIQIELDNNNNTNIISTDQNYRSALQLAPDGKIYQTHTINYGQGSAFLNIIQNPNESGANCNYSYMSYYLSAQNTSVHQGLPNFVQSFFRSTTGVAEISDSFGINIYPNPVASVIHIKSDRIMQGSIIINDLTGKELYRIKVDNINQDIDISNLKKGIYFIDIYNDNQKLKVFKFIKE